MRALWLASPAWAAWFTLKSTSPSLCFSTVDFQMNEIFRVAMRMKFAGPDGKTLPTCTIGIGQLAGDEMGEEKSTAQLVDGKTVTVMYDDRENKAEKKVAPGICVVCTAESGITDDEWDQLRFSFEAMDDLNELPQDAWNHLYGPGKGFDFHQSLDIVQAPEATRANIEKNWKSTVEVTMRKLLHLKAHSQTEEKVRAESSRYGTSTLTRIWTLTLAQVALMAVSTLYQASAVGQYLKRVRLLG
jgi:hypothetical protein